MAKRFAAACIVLLCMFGAVAVAEQPVAVWTSGTLYFQDIFQDIGIQPEELALTVLGYKGEPFLRQLVDKRTLQAHEYAPADSPEGIVAYSIRLDDAFDVAKYDFIEIALDFAIESAAAEGPFTSLRRDLRGLTNAADSREWFVTANGFQFLPDALYLYRLQTDGVARRSVEVVGSFVHNPFATGGNNTMFMQTVGVWNRDGRRRGTDDADTFFVVGGDYLNVTYTRWLPESALPGDAAPMYYMGEDMSFLGVGERAVLPLYEWPGATHGASVTITKVAALRDHPLADSFVEFPLRTEVGFPDPIQWPDGAVGQIVVIKDGSFVRQGGSVNYNLVGKASAGDIFFVIGRSDSGWYAVEWTDGQTVYIAPSRVEFTPRVR